MLFASSFTATSAGPLVGAAALHIGRGLGRSASAGGPRSAGGGAPGRLGPGASDEDSEGGERLRLRLRAKPARAPRGYASVASDRHGRPLHLAVRQPYEVDPVCASHGREPVAAQHGNPWRRAGFGRIAGGKFARDQLRHGYAFTTT